MAQMPALFSGTITTGRPHPIHQREMIPFPLQSGLILPAVILLFVTWVGPLSATDVSIQKVKVPPQNVEDIPHSYLKIIIAGEIFRSVTLEDWTLLDNLYGYDFVATPPAGLAGFIGLRIIPFVDKESKPILVFTPELLEAQLKRIKPEGATYEGSNPTLPTEGTSVVEFDLFRTESQHGNDSRHCLCNLCTRARLELQSKRIVCAGGII